MSTDRPPPSGELPDPARLDALLSAAARPSAVDPGAESAAVAAFRASHASGVRTWLTRRRDDWRPRSPWRRAALRAVLGALVAGLTRANRPGSRPSPSRSSRP
ncbi:hypothetical protein [Streptomyces apocyni]|uniref:hypothetical protein n=1 Tax=Streptomyces apocyni TaxID=2654677 RepID=UPI0018D1DCBA|nr:hypothetical protein [Streptomyces apocyni]